MFKHGQGKPTTEGVMSFDETTYLILVLRYKELANAPGSGEESVPFDIDGHITEHDTGVIDSDYMNSRFTKYLKALKSGQSKEALAELHKTFATLTQEEQKYANIFLHDIQRGDVNIDKEKTLRDYITEYQSRAKKDQIHRMTDLIGIDEEKLQRMMELTITTATINEFGRYDDLKATIDKSKAKAYLESLSGTTVKMKDVNIKIGKLLRAFIFEGGFDLEE